LSDGTHEDADVLIVADGYRSKIRKSLLPQEELRFAGFTSINGIANVDKMPALADGQHGLVCGPGTSLFLSPESDHSLLWSLAMIVDEPHEDFFTYRDATEEVKEQRKKAWKEEALLKGRQLPPLFLDLVHATPLSSVRILNGFDKMPHASVGNIVFLGDSAHAVTPFSGNGANMAMLDGLKLADALTDARHPTLRAALSTYEQEMIPRTARVVKQGRWMIRAVHTTSALQILGRNALFHTLGFVLAHPTLSKLLVLGAVGMAGAFLCKAVVGF